MKAFLFWYELHSTSKPVYIWVIAVSEKQAKYFFYQYCKRSLKGAYDFDPYPCYFVNCRCSHKVGDILGEDYLFL